MIDPPAVRIPGPLVPGAPPKPGFPVIATIAPVVVSGVLFAVTGSPFMLLLAALGPGGALAAGYDSVRGPSAVARRCWPAITPGYRGA